MLLYLPCSFLKEWSPNLLDVLSWERDGKFLVASLGFGERKQAQERVRKVIEDASAEI